MAITPSTFSPGDHCPLAPEGEDSGYHCTRERITLLLIRNTLIESLQRFNQENEPYPFVHPHRLRPGTVSSSKEYHLHNSALVLLLSGHLPAKLRKHFRCRPGNRMRMSNLMDVAPDLLSLKNYNPQQRYSTHPDFDQLIQRLLPLDFSLLIQQTLDQERHESVYELTHFHVKIERILDSALRSMGIFLNYLEKDLYEKGDGFVELLEKKFFEYFNFHHNSAGRRSAATLAAQLLARENQAGTVFITSQQDRRLTLFSTTQNSSSLLRKTHIVHYTLLALNKEQAVQLKKWGREVGLSINRDYRVARQPDAEIFILKTRFEHTPAASPSQDGLLRAGINRREKWVRLVAEEIISIKPSCPDVIHFPCVYAKQIDWKKVRKISP
ncbi:MAG: hypothetical protein HQL72_04955 [Magnetococcales bacterium]|nr:hypothetical protein [Magnetococcales bacterium]